ncbi:MAG: hypothetical protein Q4A93_06060 [Actinomycetota bacterium]|nr:hypothetical protein [Actinomycetota bacterium]
MRDGSPAPGPGRGPRKSARKTLKRSKSRAAGVLLGILAVLALGAIAAQGMLTRFAEGDATQTIQGEWQLLNEDVTCVFDSTQLKLPDGVVYDYTMDPSKHTIVFKVGEKTGSCSYAFSRHGDALQLKLTEGEGKDKKSVKLVKLSDDKAATPVGTRMDEPAPSEEPEVSESPTPSAEETPAEAASPSADEAPTDAAR